MIFVGTETECAEVIAELDAAHGYPRGYTEADIEAGLVVRHGRGPWAPIESIRTETVAESMVDGDERVVHLPELRDEHRQRVGRKRVLRILNRGSREALVALPGIGPARADALIARREQGRLTRLDDLVGVLPPAALQALRDHAHTKTGDDDEAVAARAAGKAKA
jgi:hypothetical protein